MWRAHQSEVSEWRDEQQATLQRGRQHAETATEQLMSSIQAQAAVLRTAQQQQWEYSRQSTQEVSLIRQRTVQQVV